MNLYQVNWVEIYIDGDGGKEEVSRFAYIEANNEKEACDKADATQIKTHPLLEEARDFFAEFIKELPCDSCTFDFQCSEHSARD